MFYYILFNYILLFSVIVNLLWLRPLVACLLSSENTGGRDVRGKDASGENTWNLSPSESAAEATFLIESTEFSSLTVPVGQGPCARFTDGTRRQPERSSDLSAGPGTEFKPGPRLPIPPLVSPAARAVSCPGWHITPQHSIRRKRPLITCQGLRTGNVTVYVSGFVLCMLMGGWRVSLCPF